MHRYAWLELCGGVWHLLTDNPSERVRTWTDKEEALRQLADEGWLISGPYPERRQTGGHSGGTFCGFALERTVH